MQNCPTNLRSLALASVPVLATMAPKHNKGVTVSLHELHQELGADSVQSSLPSQSSGVEREGPERSEGAWRPDRAPHGDRDDGRGDFQNEAADGDFDWRGGAASREPLKTREMTSSFRRHDGGEENFSRDAMPSRSDMVPKSGTRVYESKGFESRGGGGGFDRRADDDVDFGDVRSGGIRRVATSTTAESRPPRSGLSSTMSSVWGGARDTRSAGATDDAWRSNVRVDTRPEAMKNRFRPVTATLVAGESDKAKPSADSSGPETSVAPSSPLKAVTPQQSPSVVESSRPSPAKPETAVNRAAGLLNEPERPSIVREEAPVLEPLIIKKRVTTTAGGTATTAPFRSRRRPGTSTLDDLVKKKEAEAEAAAPAPVQAPVDDKKSAYRKNLQEREQKRRDEEDKRRQEKEEEETRQRLVIEKLMTGDQQKMKKLQGNIETGLQSGADGSTLLPQFQAALTDDDLQSLIPSIVVAKCLVLQSIETLRPTFDPSSTVSDQRRLELVAALVRTLKPTLAFLFEKSGIRWHKLKFLVEIQRLVHACGFPRVSGGLTLIEAIWDSLYMERVIEEQYFEMWYEATDDDTPGRSEVLFQMLGWFTWLQSALEEGQAEIDDGDEDDEEDEF